MVQRAAQAGWSALAVGLLLTHGGCFKEQYENCEKAKAELLKQYEACQKDLAGLREAMSKQAGAEQKARELQAELDRIKGQLDTAQKKVGVLEEERGKMKEMVDKLLEEQKAGPPQVVPIPAETQNRLKEFAKRHKGFTFDERLGVSKFQSDILFDEGKDIVKEDAAKMLGEFAEIFKSADARDLNLLIVGHTDDQPIVLPDTKKNHPTNWHLSVHRAIRVLQTLEKAGVSAHRMGVSGYGEYQPVVPNTEEATRQKNRRVEIFVVQAPMTTEAPK